MGNPECDKREILLEVYIRTTEGSVFRKPKWQSFLLKALITLLILPCLNISSFFSTFLDDFYYVIL